MLEEIKQRVLEANLELVKKGLVIYTWGNVSGIDRDKGLVVIKPSGVDYAFLKADDMVVVSLETGKVVEGGYKPSSDLDTHLELYRKYPQIGGVAHTHSTNAVAFAQAGMDIPALGTTHADCFYGDIPCTRELTKEEVESDYELNTMSIPGIIVKNHGPFSWCRNAEESVHNAVVLDKVAEIDLKTLLLNKDAEMKQYILDKHYFGKHGPGASYGQK